MKRVVLCLLCGLMPVPAVAQVEAPPQSSPAIDIGTTHSLDSEILGEERAYWVYLPASYRDTTYGAQSYPVLYLLDGDAHFHSASGVVQFMSTGINGNLQVPEMIVVAVPNTDRMRDLTPTRATIGYDGAPSSAFEGTGGGRAFLRFLRAELFPEIESTYRTQPYKVFVGHSLGGLVALDALVHAPDMFDSYVAIDPSLWWDEQKLVGHAEGYFSQAVGLRGGVYISSAAAPPAEPGTPNLMRESAQAFTRAMEVAASADFRPALEIFDAEDHGSVPLLSLYHGLLHIFDGYKPDLGRVLEDPSSLGTHFEQVSSRLGFTVSPPGRVVNQLGYSLLAQDVDKAIEFFEFNVSSFPESSQAHDSLGLGYMTRGDTARAIESYERSLELNPDNENAKSRLRELTGDVEARR